MPKRILVGFSTLLVVATVLAPSVSLAKDSQSKKLPRLTAPVAIDGQGDSQGISDFKKDNENTRLKAVTGKVTAVSATSITIARNLKTVTTDPTSTVTKQSTDPTTTTTTSLTYTIDAKTHVLRKYKGTATVNEIMVGDSVKIWAAKLSGTALVIWDTSIWYVEVRGAVSSLDSTAKAFTLTVTKNKVEYSTTVKYDDATIFLMKDGTSKTAADLANGQTIKIKGSWNTLGKFILAKRIVIIPATS